MVQYLIRLDDLCPTNNVSKWTRFFDLFDLYDIKPIIAVIPDNRDPKLLACGNFNINYWEWVRQLQKKGYEIAIHGFEHRYVNQESGILKHNNRSEFAGLPLHEQEEKIRAASAIFRRERIHADIFVAPAHSFDYNTLVALKRHSDVKIISDGLLSSPYRRLGFNWVPVQLSEVEHKTTNTWTFNYHPETCTDEAFAKLEEFITKHHRQFASTFDLDFKPYGVTYYLQEHARIYSRFGRGLLKTQLLHLKGALK